MNDELNIPLLEDLVSRGQIDSDENPPQMDSNEHHEVEFVEEEIRVEDTVAQKVARQEQEFLENLPDEILPLVDTPPPTQTAADIRDEISDDASVRELLIDEEIRMILDKHMDKAYDEIIRLLNNKIS